MPRVPPASKESIPREIWNAYLSRYDALDRLPEWSPGCMMLNSPEAWKHYRNLQRCLRDNNTTLSSKVMELAMILAGREMDSPDVWNLHAASARRAGLSDGLVDALRERKELPQITADEAALVNYGRELFRNHRVSEATFQTSLNQFGVKGLIELTMLMAFYVIPSFIAHAFQIEPPPNTLEPLLPI